MKHGDKAEKMESGKSEKERGNVCMYVKPHVYAQSDLSSNNHFLSLIPDDVTLRITEVKPDKSKK